MNARLVAGVLILTALSSLAHADCSPSSTSLLCSSYDFNLPVNISSSLPGPAFTVMGGTAGIGTLNPATSLDVVSTASTVRGLSLIQYSNDASPAQFNYFKSRGTSDVPLAIQANDGIGAFNFRGYDGVNPWSSSNPGSSVGVQLSAVATENWTGSAHGSALRFATTPNGTTSIATRMFIDQSGRVGIGTITPAATLDVNGFVKLAKNTSAPVACDASHDSSLAVTSAHKLCICDGASWVSVNDGATACVW